MSRAHTISRIRHLAAIGHVKPKRKVGRWPPAKPPKLIGAAYHASIVRGVCEPARFAFAEVLPAIMRELAAQRMEDGHMDAGTRTPKQGKQEAEHDKHKAAKESAASDRELKRTGEHGKRAAALIDRAAKTFAERFHPSALHAVVAQFGQATDRHARLQLDQQLRSAIGVPLSAIEKPHRDRLQGWTQANVDLIVTIPDRYFERLRSDVADAFGSSMHPSTFAENLADTYDISDRDAERIARDQTLKLSADLNHDRMQALGVETGTWRTLKDGRVCPECEEKDGQEFALSEGIDGVLPGNCHPVDRCYTEPNLDAIING